MAAPNGRSERPTRSGLPGGAHGAFSFDPMSALFPFVGSLAGGWLRFRSGSPLFALLIHAAANLGFHLSAYRVGAHLFGG